MTWQAQVRRYFDAPGAVEFDTEFLCERTGGHTGRPNDVLRFEDLAALQLDPVFADVLHPRAGADFDAEFFKLSLRAGGQFRRQMSQDPQTRLNQNNPRLGGINASKVA